MTGGAACLLWARTAGERELSRHRGAPARSVQRDAPLFLHATEWRTVGDEDAIIVANEVHIVDLTAILQKGFLACEPRAVQMSLRRPGLKRDARVQTANAELLAGKVNELLQSAVGGHE
jgi:hypothetical protein